MEMDSPNYPILFEDYKKLKLYKEKLRFFDEHFGLLPFDFPEFQVDIQSLLNKDTMDILLDLFEKEKALSGNTFKKKITANETEFTFNVTPENSNRQYFNDYILGKFLSFNRNYLKKIEILDEYTGYKKERILDDLIDATDNIILLQDKLKNSKERSYKYQFINVFCNGYSDYQIKNSKQFSYKKRFIELYLYAHGILHAIYIEELKKRSSPILSILKLALPVFINVLSLPDSMAFDILFSDQCFLLN